MANHPNRSSRGPRRRFATINGRLDKRYTIALEYYGAEQPGCVARFCGEWLGVAHTYSEANNTAIAAYNKRMNAPDKLVSLHDQDQARINAAYKGWEADQ